MTAPDERWLASLWPFVRARLPDPAATVLEIGCGPLGGFVPALRAAGYDAVGVDPEAPAGARYHQVDFEQYELSKPAEAIVACTSLHHVADLGAVLDLIRDALVPGGALVVVEWAREWFDETTARWCFDRLPLPGTDHSWLQRLRDEWRAAGLRWDEYCEAWAAEEGLHSGQDIVRELDARFDRQLLSYGPYFFADLADTSEGDEQAAIDAGLIRPGRVEYAGLRRSRERQTPL